MIAEDLLGVPAEEIARGADLGLADSALAETFEQLAARELSEQDFALWVAAKLRAT